MSATKPEDRQGAWGGTHHLWPRSFVHQFLLPASTVFQPFCFVNTHRVPDDSARRFPSGFTAEIRAAVQGKVEGAVFTPCENNVICFAGQTRSLREGCSRRRSKARHGSRAAPCTSSCAGSLARCVLHTAGEDTWDPAPPSPPAAFLQHSCGCQRH